MNKEFVCYVHVINFVFFVYKIDNQLTNYLRNCNKYK